MTGDWITFEGVQSLSEMLKENTTLTSLNLWSEEKKRIMKRERNGIKGERLTGNIMGNGNVIVRDAWGNRCGELVL